MSTRGSSRRNSSYVPDFDPYGYSPYDPRFDARSGTQRSTSTSRRSGYEYDIHDELNHEHAKDRRASAPAERRSRRKSVAKDEDRYPHPEAEESGWDTDYDPRDKYYLSNDDFEDALPSPPERSPTRHSSRRHRRRSGHHQDGTKRSSHSDRRGEGEHSDRRHHGSAPERPRPSRNASNTSSNNRPHRPRPVHRPSSHGVRPRKRYPPNASRSKAVQPSGSTSNMDWSSMGQAALKAGAITALKVSSGRGTYLDKGTKVATAAIGAALVDSFLNRKKPKAKGGVRHAALKQVTEQALGNMVMGPALKSIAKRR